MIFRSMQYLMTKSAAVAAFLILLAAPPPEASAQIPNELERSRYSPAAYYNYSEPGDVTVLVNVWGTVRNPGLYEVPRGTTLSTLFSVAGGPSVAQRTGRQTRTIEVRLVRNEDGLRQPVFHSVMENDIAVSSEDPVLQEGDVLTVETVLRQGFSWRDIFPVLGAAASMALIIERLTR